MTLQTFKTSASLIALDGSSLRYGSITDYVYDPKTAKLAHAADVTPCVRRSSLPFSSPSFRV
jgi:hypothetical protein